MASVLTENLMGFLALIAFAVALGPLVFSLNPSADATLQSIEWALVAIFILDFVVQLNVAEDRSAWLWSPWRFLDLVTILGPFVALLPGVSDAASGSLSFRLLRVGRAFALGTRAGGAATGKRRGSGAGGSTSASLPKVIQVAAGPVLQPAPSDWSTCLAWTQNLGPAWFHVTHIDPDRFREAASSTGADIQGLDEAFDFTASVRGRPAETGAATLFIWLPTVAEKGFPAVLRVRLALVITEQGILSATPEDYDLPASLANLISRTALPSYPFPIRVTVAILTLAYNRFQYTAQRFDDEVRHFEAIPVAEGERSFLEATFRLRREISATALDLGQLRTIVRNLADGRSKLRGFDLSEEAFLDTLAADVDSLYDRVTSLKEDVKSVIELHINVKSFEMNQFLKILAIISFMGLIPSVIGGLLGMNVEGNPWPVTLGQVVFTVGFLAATSLYVFAVRGWLK